VQIVLSEIPSADWKRLFTKRNNPPPRIPSRSVDISGNLVKFRTEASSVEAKTAWVDRWIERANQKESGMGGRLEEERRRRRDEHLREQRSWPRLTRAGKSCSRWHRCARGKTSPRSDQGEPQQHESPFARQAGSGQAEH